MAKIFHVFNFHCVTPPTKNILMANFSQTMVYIKINGSESRPRKVVSSDLVPVAIITALPPMYRKSPF